MKEGFIYIWYDKFRKMYYLGCHWGTENDGYICSSNRMRDAHRRRPQDFRRRIIQRNITRDRLLEIEYKWLLLISDNELGKRYYNLSKKHFGHWTNNPDASLSIREKIGRVNRGKKFSNRKRPPPFSKTHLQKMSERSKGNTYNVGRVHSEEVRQKMSDSQKNRGSPSVETRLKISASLMGHSISEEVKRKISETQKGRKLTEETRRKMSEAKKGKPKVPGSGRQKKNIA